VKKAFELSIDDSPHCCIPMMGIGMGVDTIIFKNEAKAKEYARKDYDKKTVKKRTRYPLLWKNKDGSFEADLGLVRYYIKQVEVR